MRRSRKTKMTSTNIIFIYLSIIFHKSHGLEVIQPYNRTVNPDGTVFISCEYTGDNRIVDVRLNLKSLTDRTLLCQKGRQDCENIFMHPENPKKWLFVLWNIGPKDMNMMYECEFTMNKNDLEVTERGNPTRLLQGQKETEKDCVPSSPLPSAAQADQPWILIGLLALLLLCICVITSVCVIACVSGRLRKSEEEPENGTYVEMRKAPLPRNPPVGVYCGN